MKKQKEKKYVVSLTPVPIETQYWITAPNKKIALKRALSKWLTNGDDGKIQIQPKIVLEEKT